MDLHLSHRVAANAILHEVSYIVLFCEENLLVLKYLLVFYIRSFTISGEEMEIRAAHTELHSILRKCFGMTPLEKFELEQLDRHLLGNKKRVTITKGGADGGGVGKDINGSGDTSHYSEGADAKEEEEDTCIGGGSFMRGSKSRLSQG